MTTSDDSDLDTVKNRMTFGDFDTPSFKLGETPSTANPGSPPQTTKFEEQKTVTIIGNKFVLIDGKRYLLDSIKQLDS